MRINTGCLHQHVYNPRPQVHTVNKDELPQIYRDKMQPLCQLMPVSVAYRDLSPASPPKTLLCTRYLVSLLLDSHSLSFVQCVTSTLCRGLFLSCTVSLSLGTLLQEQVCFTCGQPWGACMDNWFVSKQGKQPHSICKQGSVWHDCCCAECAGSAASPILPGVLYLHLLIPSSSCHQTLPLSVRILPLLHQSHSAYVNGIYMQPAFCTASSNAARMLTFAAGPP